MPLFITSFWFNGYYLKDRDFNEGVKKLLNNSPWREGKQDTGMLAELAPSIRLQINFGE